MNWDNFFIAQVGASAALTGLIFVAVSINLTRILALPHLPARAMQSLLLLLNILFLASILLVPCQYEALTGWEIIGVGAFFCTVLLLLSVSVIRKTPVAYRSNAYLNLWLTLIAILPFPVAGILVLTIGGKGLYLLAPGILFSYCKSMLDAWVLLVEINR